MDKHNLTPEELTKYQKHFTESDFWFKVSTLAKKAGVKITYYALVLYYTLTDPKTPTRYKAVIRTLFPSPAWQMTGLPW